MTNLFCFFISISINHWSAKICDCICLNLQEGTLVCLYNLLLIVNRLVHSLQCSLFVFAWPLGNSQNIQTETWGAHQPSDNMQQCHQQTEKMPKRPTVQLDQVSLLWSSANTMILVQIVCLHYHHSFADTLQYPYYWTGWGTCGWKFC